MKFVKHFQCCKCFAFSRARAYDGLGNKKMNGG